MEYNLNDTWSVWYHSINDTKWDNDSYTGIFSINNLYDYQAFTSVMNDKILHKCMVFLMRGNIFPTWEDPNNIKGCCISYKISNKTLVRDFNLILLKVINEGIMKNSDQFKLVNGISISPKREFNIIKIWFKECITVSDINEFQPSFIKSKSILKKNK